MKVQHEGVEKLIGDYLMDVLYSKYDEPAADNVNEVMVRALFGFIKIPFFLKWIPIQSQIIKQLDKYTPEVPLSMMEKLMDLLKIPYTSGRRRQFPGGVS